MDQPTYLKLHITGAEQSVVKAANAAARIIEQDSPRKYFEGRVQDLLKYGLRITGDSNAEFSVDMDDCYWAIYEEDISTIADTIVQASPDVKFHLSARITMTYEEGYDLCVDIDYADGEMNVDTSEDFYEDDEYEDEDEEEYEEEEDEDEE